VHRDSALPSQNSYLLGRNRCDQVVHLDQAPTELCLETVRLPGMHVLTQLRLSPLTLLSAYAGSFCSIHFPLPATQGQDEPITSADCKAICLSVLLITG
jgi:hypothetical protein